MNGDIKSFVKNLEFTNGKYDVKDIFREVISLTTFIIQTYLIGNKEYQEHYNTLLKKYTDDEQLKLKELVLELAEIYNKQTEPVDLMTDIFGELGLGNKHTGQFFTPTNISDLMAKIVGIDANIESDISTKGYATLHEPTSGAGGMILAYARELKDKGYNPSKNLFVVAWDIDILCTYMTYVQLAMYDIPAVVTNGDTLALKEHFTLYTPQYYWGMWNLKTNQIKPNVEVENVEKEEIRKGA